MMIRGLVLLVLLVVLPFTVVFDNPIYHPYINELVIVQGGDWTLEMLLYSQQSMDGWALVSKYDTGYFKTGLTVGPGWVLFTRANLQKEILFSRVSDRIVVLSQQGTVGYLSYGTLPGVMIAYPRFGQAICYNVVEGFYYLDNSPTLGQPNDTLNGTGELCGVVMDTLGTPLPNVTVTYHDWMGQIVTTDSSGMFHIHDYAKAQDVYFTLPGYNGSALTVQMRPDTTINLLVKLSRISSVYEEPATLPKRIRLLPGYPNPFNPETTIELHLPRNTTATVTIHTGLGAQVAELASGRLAAGIHRFRWRPVGFASGVYFCRAAAGNQVIVNKLLYIR